MFFLVAQLQESKMTTCSVRYEPHLSDKARSSKRPGFQSQKCGMPRYSGVGTRENAFPHLLALKQEDPV